MNDTLLPTPSLLPQMSSLIASFRTHTVALTADVGKMFREVALEPQEKDFHRFLARQPDGSIQDRCMTRLTFGVSASPYLAIRIVQQIADDYSKEFPRTAVVASNQLYVDDCLTGAESVESAVELHQALVKLMDKGRMQLRKWRSSHHAVMQHIPDALRDSPDALLTLRDPTVCGATLGIRWDTQSDLFYVVVPQLEDSTVITKRSIASTVASVYDVMGWFAPATFMVKTLLQKLWTLKLGWDDPVPDTLIPTWERWKTSLPALQQYPISRRYSSHPSPIISTTLHGFADASNKGYGGVIYLRFLHQDTTVQVPLVMSKTKVAPLRTLTIPRLELSAALLTSKLLNRVAKDLSIPTKAIHGWTDSMVTLGWIRQESAQFKTFVSNRISQIQQHLPTSQWHYVPTKYNPADLASRGATSAQLLNSALWWEGPPWLPLDPSCWPTPPTSQQPSVLPEVREAVLVTITEPPLADWRFSSWEHLVRVLAWVNRFITRSKKKPLDLPMVKEYLAPVEVDQARIILLKQSQHETFTALFRQLGDSKQPTGQLATLCPFIDGQGLLTVGGRLRHLASQSSKAHPVILHKNCWIVKLLARHVHYDSYHPGPATLLTLLAEQYYIVGARQLVKQVSRQCTICQKAYGKTSHQLMGQLPPARLQPAPPFDRVGVDFAGPLTTVRGNPRRPTRLKTYICVFVCMATKAIHLEICTDLSKDTFMASF